MTVPTPAQFAKPLPKHSDLVGFEHAVAGHDGVLSDVDGELFIKPCTLAEVAFYEASYRDHPEFAQLMSTFLGTLQLSPEQNKSLEEQGAALLAKQGAIPLIEPGAVIAKHGSPDGKPPPKTKKIVTDTAVVLENAAAGFVRPNILDVKLGVRLWADDASQDKKDRFDIITENTTHKNLGFRIAGMRAWQGPNAPRDVDIDRDGYKIYDKDYGRFSVTEDNVEDSFRKFFFNPCAGVDEELSKLVCQAFIADLEHVQEVMENQESRMFSASLLFVYEGDGQALRAAMEEASRTPPPPASRASDEEDDDDDIDTTPKIYTLKVIDFAHAQWTPGLGPDENSLLGVRSVTKILRSLSGVSEA